MHFQNPPIETKKGMNSKQYYPERTFFFERQDGSVFSTNEQEAYAVMKGRNQIVGFRTIPPKLIGVSDGSKYAQAINEAKQIFNTEGFEKAQERIKLGHQEELDSARGNIIQPRNFDTIGSNGQPVNMQDLK